MKPLHRHNVQTDALICLNGTLPENQTLRLFRETPIIAADGAAQQLLERGFTPHIIVGDLDSFPASSRSKLPSTTEIVHDPSQDTNDFEKALRLARSRDLASVLVVGMHGGDLEHTLNNWSVLMRFSRLMDVRVLDRQRIAMAIHGSVRFPSTIGETISLVPQPRARITTLGLQWELHNEELEMGGREGARNRATATEVFLHVHDGSVLLFLDEASYIETIIQR